MELLIKREESTATSFHDERRLKKKKPYDVSGIVCGRASFVYKLPSVHVMKQLGGETLRLCLNV